MAEDSLRHFMRGQSSAVSPTRHLPVLPRCRHSALLPDGPAHADCVCLPLL